VNILSITDKDHAACAYFLAQAVNRYTEHTCRAVRRMTIDRGYIHYPTDIAAPPEREVLDMWAWADVVHIHDNNPWRKLCKPPKPTVISYNGSMYRRNRGHLDRRDADKGWISTCTTLNVKLLSGRLRWLPCCRPNLSSYRDPADGFLVVQAPTKRQYKQTDQVIACLEGLADKGVTYDIIERASWEECLQRKGQAHVLVDQFDTGIGCNAVEAWLMGIPVVAGCTDAHAAEFEREVGYVPFTRVSARYEGNDTHVNAGELRRVLLRLKGDVGFYAAEVARGARYVKTFHTPGAVAARAVALYEEALGNAPAQPEPQPEPVELADVGRAGMVLVRYIGGNTGRQTFWGAVTGQVYEFGGDREYGYVDRRDVGGLLHPSRRSQRAEFEVV